MQAMVPNDPVRRSFVADFGDEQVHILEWDDGKWEASRRGDPHELWSAPVALEEEEL